MTELSPKMYRLLLLLRAALIQALNATDDALSYPRTIPPRGERKRRQSDSGTQPCYNKDDN
jgi:hypothetical protein